MAEIRDTERENNSLSSKALSGRELAKAAGLVVIGFVLSRLLGLVREALIGATYGTGGAYDAYAAALQVPDTIFFVIAGGAIGSAFIPTFTAYLARDQREEAWRMASSVINVFILAMVAVSGLCIIFARPLAMLTLASGFRPEIQDLTVRLIRIMLISSVIFGISGIQMGMLNAYQRFLLPAIAPAMYNIGIIFGAVVLGPALGIGIEGAAWGVVLGALLHLLVQLPGLFKIEASYQLLFDFKHPGVREVAYLMGPRVLGQAIIQVNFWVNKTLASFMPEGSLGAINRAWYLLMLPLGLIAQSVATAVFPTFARQVAEDDVSALKQTLGQVLRAVLFLALPATVGLVVLRTPIVRLVYEHGVNTFEGSEAVAWALLFYGLGLVAHSLVEILTRAFYAMHDTRTPVIVGGVAMLLNIGLSLLLIRVIGEPDSLARGAFAGLALANTLATSLESIVLLVLLVRRVQGLDWARIASGLLRAGVASVGMGLALWGGMPAVAALGQFAGPLVGVAVGGGVFWGLALLLRSPEAGLFTREIMKRLGLSSLAQRLVW